MSFELDIDRIKRVDGVIGETDVDEVVINPTAPATSEPQAAPDASSGSDAYRVAVKRLVLPPTHSGESITRETIGFVCGLYSDGKLLGSLQTSYASTINLTADILEWDSDFHFLPLSTPQLKAEHPTALLAVSIFAQDDNGHRRPIFWANTPVFQEGMAVGMTSLKLWEYRVPNGPMPFVAASTFQNTQSLTAVLVVHMDSGHRPRTAEELANAVFQMDGRSPAFDLNVHLELIKDLYTKVGWNRRRVAIGFNDLTVTVDVAADTSAPTVGSMMKSLIMPSCKPPETKTILKGISGHVRPGEMLLVLGPPGSGCSTLLQALAGKLPDNLKVSGSLLYNGEPLGDYAKQLRMIADEDIHMPSLTVQATIRFAAEMCVPKEHPYRERQIKSITTNIMTALGIYHVRDSLVGDATLRGVSGGEKKRVTIGEMVAARAEVLLLDDYSKGLDASATLDIAKTLRVISRAINTSFIATQYQASQEVFEQFDNVLVLQNGRSVYFGPTRDALAYFESIGQLCPKRRSVPDFLSSLCVSLPDADADVSTLDAPQPSAEDARVYYVVLVPVAVYSQTSLEAVVLETVEAGTIVRVELEQTHDELRWLHVNDGWVPLLDDAQVCPIAITDCYVMGLTGQYEELNGRYPMDPVRDESGRPTFSRRNFHKDGPVAVIMNDEPGSAWLLKLDGETIAYQRSDKLLPGREGLLWHVKTAAHSWQEDVEMRVTYVHTAPRAADTLAEIFKKSKQGVELAKASAKLAAPPLDKASQENPVAQAALRRTFALPLLEQTRHLAEREILLLRKDPFFLRSRLGRMVGIGVIIGALFLDLDLTIESGLYSRPGLIFFVMTFLAMSSFGFLDIFIERRNVYYKQRDANFYSALPYVLANVLVDIPFQFIEGFLFVTLVFWMTGLNQAENGLRYFFMWLTASMLGLCMSMFTKAVSCIAKDSALAQVMGAGPSVLFILFSGYMIPREQIPYEFIWIHYISPLKYAFEALMLNEFDGLTFTSSRNPAITISGLDAIDKNFSIKTDNQLVYRWCVPLILFGFTLVYFAIAVLALRFISYSGSSSSLQFAKKERSKRVRAVKNALKNLRKRLNPRTAVAVHEVQRIDTPAYFTWQNLNYEVDMPKERGQPRERKRLLSNVTGYVKSGMMVALMGSSGAGKTTLLDVLARRKTGGHISGNVQINGEVQDDMFKRLAGYVEQQDIHTPRATVREAFMFSATLRLPAGTTKEERSSIVLKTAALLGLTEVLDAVIGSPELFFGLSTEARKRVTIGVELVADPRILFMDEPTSGLDTAGALNVIRAARAIADSGHAVVCTIHQPSAEIFEMFDHLLLLQRGGETVYFGPIGKHSASLLGYFERNGGDKCEERLNPADYILTQIGAGIGKRTKANWNLLWKASPECAALERKLTEPQPLWATPFHYESDVPTSTLFQLRHVFVRTFRTFWRTPSYNFTRIMFQIVMALLLGLSYLQLGDSQTDLRARVAVLFFSGITGIVGTLNAIPPMISERAVYYRERAAGAYRSTAYVITWGVVELPFIGVCSILFSVIIYWMVGFQTAQFGFFFLTLLTFQCFCVFYGQVVAVLAPSAMLAAMIAPAITSLLNLFTGFLIKSNDIPPYFIWIYYLNPYSYFLQAIVSNEMEGATFSCTAAEVASNQCFTTGEAYLSFYGWSVSEKWRSWGILLLFTGFMRFLTTLGLTYKVHVTR
eukprot:m.234774 g.234774  ORF g.234774 m.234774 type:complete len:1699 (+) comp12715_c0_seq1:66-5162(+)